MQYISLYRKYRPKTFNDVVGQNVVVKILQNSIIENKISHAYIFSGPRGTGKTSIAKIFSKAINCSNNINGDLCGTCEICKHDANDEIDIVEIDAASNNGVDEIREIRNNIKLMPSVLKYKVYIIDEVHMLSTSAFNALLKTLEEPPSHAIFILATTEFNKIPATVISRCQKFDFKKINKKDIYLRLKYILECENKELGDNIINLIADLSDGGLRDAINLLDQVLSIDKSDLSTDDVYNLIGDISEQSVFDLLSCITNGNIKDVVSIIDKYNEQGKNFTNICNRLEELIKNILIYNSTSNYFDKEYENKLQSYSKVDYEKLLDISKELYNLGIELKKSTNQKMLIEIYFLKLTIMFTKKEYDKQSQHNETVTPLPQKENKTDIINNVPEEEISIDNKKIKINNTLYGANKQLKIDFIANFKQIEEYLSNKEFNSIANLLNKSNPEVVSDKNVLFTFKNSFEVVLFDKNIEDVQKFLKKLYKTNYVVTAVSEEDWNKIKKEYIENTKNGVKYEYIEEKQITKKAKKSTALENSLEDIFGNDFTSL